MAGRRNFDYNRVRVLKAGLDVVAPGSTTVFTIDERDKSNAKALSAAAGQNDVIYVPPFRQKDIAFIKANSAGKPVIFDPIIGTYITRVVDYGWWWRKPVAFRRDKRHFEAADVLLFDTDSHRQWAVDLFGLDPQKCHTLYIGADLSRFPPIDRSEPVSEREKLKIGFYGTLAPLQGGAHILKAAWLLRHHQHLNFEFIGVFDKKAELQPLMDKFQSKNVSILPHMPYDELAMRMRDFDIGLGVFGESLKADVVIPNKLYHFAALGLPIITRHSIGVAELFSHERDLLMIPPSAEALAAAILRLAEDRTLRQRLGAAAAETMKSRLSAACIAHDFLQIAAQVIRQEKQSA